METKNNDETDKVEMEMENEFYKDAAGTRKRDCIHTLLVPSKS